MIEYKPMAANAKPNKEAPWPSSQHGIATRARDSFRGTYPTKEQGDSWAHSEAIWCVLLSVSFPIESLGSPELVLNNTERVEGVAYRKGSHLLAGTLVGVNIHSSCSPRPVSIGTH